MNIALIGYGKMGHAIEQVAVKRGHNIVLRITSANKQEMYDGGLNVADIAIEFTRPEFAREHVELCFDAGINVVCGTTGWNEQLEETAEKAVLQNVGFLHASNFSIGVNIFFEVNKMLATIMREHKEYDVSVTETHHTQKKDAPSGTAITLAEQIIERVGHKTFWALNDVNEKDAVPIIAHRVDSVPGTHDIVYSSKTDDIEIKHTAHNRDGFALGTILAAEYMAGKKGVYTMKDVLGL